MPIEVEIPGQGLAEFPDGTEKEAILSTIARSFPKLFPKANRATLGNFMRQTAPMLEASPVTPDVEPSASGNLAVPFPSSEAQIIERQAPTVEDIRIGEQPATVPRFGAPGSLARGASDVMGGFVEWALNKPEEALATLTPLAPVIAARYTPEIVIQFGNDVVAGVKGDREALGRALTMAALVGGGRKLQAAREQYLIEGASREAPSRPEDVAAQLQQPGEANLTPRDLRYVATTREPVIEEPSRIATPTPKATPGEVEAPELLRGKERQGTVNRPPVGIDITNKEGVRFGPEFWSFEPPGGRKPLAVPSEDVLPAAGEVLREVEQSAAQAAQPKGEASASEISQATTLHGDVLRNAQEGREGASQVPVREGEPGVRAGEKVGGKSYIPLRASQVKEIPENLPPPTGGGEEVPKAAAPIEEPRAAGGVEPAATSEIIGMGGAVPGEFKPAAQTITSIKNAKVEEERATRGLPPAIQAARHGQPEVWDRAMAKIDQDPGVQDRLIAELAERPRALTDLEDSLLLHRQIDLQNDYGKATRELAQAWDDGRLEDAQVWKDRVGVLSDQLKVLYDVDKTAGTETGRGLAARRMLANERFELAQMEMDLRSAKGGEKLTDKEYKELIPLQEQIAQLQKQLGAKEKELAGKVARKTPRKGATEAEKLEAWKTRSQKTAAELEKQLEAGAAIEKPKRQPIKLDEEGLHIAFRLKKLKEKWMEMLVNQQLKREELVKRVVRRTIESSSLIRGLLSSEDLSAVLRQGKFAVLAHPILAAKSIVPMLKAFASEEASFKVEQDIMTRQNTQRYLQSGLALTDMHNPSLARMEEVFMGKWLEHIPGVAGSARAYTTFLNKLRADVFDTLTTTLGDGTKATDRVIANSINVFTGRGKLPFNEQTAVGLNSILYAPRFVASRFQAVLGQPLYHGLLDNRVGFEGTAKARALVAREYAKILAGYAIIYGLAQAAGYKVGTDPKSTDFGKIIMGRTRLDPLAGVSQVTVLMSRLYEGKVTTQKGREVPIRGKVPYGGRTTADVIGSFLRQKLAPAPQLFIDVTTQKFVTGEEVTKGALAQHYLVPISYQDIFDTMQDQGVPSGTALGVLSIFGENVQTFDR